MSEIVKNSCPHYRYKPKEGKVTSCGGDVVFRIGTSMGVCKSCKRETAIIVEM